MGYKSKKIPVKLYVVQKGSANILGRDWIKAFNIRLEMMNQIVSNSKILDLINSFSNVFTSKLGNFNHKEISIKVVENAKPVFCRHRAVPLAYAKEVELELDRLEKEGVIELIDNSDWGTPLVFVQKSNGKIRICGDYKTTINKHLEDVKYPLPKIDELWNKLKKGQRFSKIDLQLAYMQFSLNIESSKLLAWNTHRGLYAVKRLPFGIKSASSIFQREIENLFKGMKNVTNFLDDIIVTGETAEEHMTNLREVLSKLEKAGLTVCKEKCVFFKEEVEYLGYKISKEGLKKTDSKIAAIINAPKPENITEVRAFTGLVNYYHKFIPRAAQILEPIYKLLKGNVKFFWSKECERAFNIIKDIIASDNCLVYFDPDLPIIVTTDASDKGISGMLSQVKEGEERTVACVSRTLMPAEKKYSTVEKEALAVHFTINKFYQYLCCNKFKLRTDQKALVALFGEHRSIPKMSANRIQRWALFLSSFDYSIEHIKGINNPVADYLSRSPVQVTGTVEEPAEGMTYIHFTESIEYWPINNKVLREETDKDGILRAIKMYIKTERWPKHLSDEIMPFYHKRQELYLDEHIIMWGHRIVVPSSLRPQILDELHAGHFGIVRCKSLARSYVYWPKIDSDIEHRVKSCGPCLKNRDNPPSEFSPWPEVDKVFDRVHIDFLQLKSKLCLILVDAYSKWVEVFPMSRATAAETQEKLREVFARMGLPRLCVSDNGPQLVDKTMEIFFKKNGIKHLTGAPYHPSSNGAAERYVRTFKMKLKTALDDPRNSGIPLSTLISRYLLTYRNTKHPVTEKSPAELVYNRSLRTRISMMAEKPSKEQQNISIKEKRCFEIGERVMVRDYRETNRKLWVAAKIINKVGKKTYYCRLDSGQVWKRHTNQVGRCSTEFANNRENELDSNNDFQYIKLPNVVHPVGESITQSESNLEKLTMETQGEPVLLDMATSSDTGNRSSTDTVYRSDNEQNIIVNYPSDNMSQTGRSRRVTNMPKKYNDFILE
ncbi:uncharacterized protein K02A2.6-like [Diabrotica virgifera virgifera]|uniref:RNA-directed DNA polymerase n=1 Tax=Diabrotica virgifera virgifera TaxID=50390 RepID=A0ABM5IJF7_DIAVI|nr:uncharacterized protein K02A2.6-like [Diabrotica virgifera virgifera]XP_050513258.1 uncharacterized protein K02A2.6-like [Diabrotica virgifera virgifera]